MMKDFLGNELRVGDSIITYVVTRTSGVELIVAKIERITRHRVWLHEWRSKDRELQKLFTTPEKCVRIIPAR